MKVSIIIIIMASPSLETPRGGERAQSDTAPKLIVIDFAEIQNWGRCR